MNVGVVIVTYNRLEKLKKCLSAYEEQIFQPSVVLVVNNASTDGTKEYLDCWLGTNPVSGIQRKVIHCQANLGGAGGFSLGIKQMLAIKTDWIWLADDDAYPERDCLQVLSSYYNELSQQDQHNVSCLCAKVIGPDGNVSHLHRRTIKKSFFQIKEMVVNNSGFLYPATPIDLFSFVGVAIKNNAIKQVGLPHSDYFIYFDDSEYALRLKGQGKILCIPSAKVMHDSPENKIKKYSWKNYYMFRNKLYTYSLYFPRRYMFIETCKTIYMIIRYYNCPASWKQFAKAIRDIHAKHLGVDERYLPGK